MKKELPFVAKWLIRFISSGKDQEVIEGDIREVLEEHSHRNAIIRWAIMMRELSGLMRPALMERRSRHTPGSTRKLTLKMIFRGLRRRLVFTITNVFGLSSSLTICLLILAFISHELSFDRYHTDAGRIFRVTYQENANEPVDGHWARVPVDWVNLLPEQFSQIEAFARFQSFRTRDIVVGNDVYRETNAYAVDAEVFDVLDLNFVEGDPSALSRPFTVVLTQSYAKKYFKEESALGQELFVVSPAGNRERYLVTGIIEDTPSNTHLPIHLLTSINKKEDRTGWAYIYAKLRSEKSGEELARALPDFVASQSTNDPPQKLNLQPIQDIHLHSHLSREIIPNGRMSYIWIFFSAALVLLFIASVNFANLSAIQSLSRTKEIGVRKVLGGSRKHLASTFYMESLVLASISAASALVFYSLSIPLFEKFLGYGLIRTEPVILLFTLVFAIVVSVLSTIYPVKVMVGLSPIAALRSFGIGNRKFSGKRVLIALQFALALGLISTLLIAERQFSFIQNKSLGLTQHNVLVIHDIPDKAKRQFEIIREQIGGMPGISDVTAIMEMPGSAVRDGVIALKPGESPEAQEGTPMDIQIVEGQFFDVMEVAFAAGSPFSKLVPSHNLPAPGTPFAELLPYLSSRPREYIINTRAAELLGWDDPREAVGQPIRLWNPLYQLQEGHITGVIADFHQESLRSEIDPVVLLQEPIWLRHLLVRTHTTHTAEVLAEIEDFWKEKYAGFPLNITLLEKEWQQLYDKERKLGILLRSFTALAVTIAILGLLGVLGYSLKVRQKELALRKVLGASLKSVATLMAREYLRAIVISLFVVIPVVWFLMEEWLSAYAYRIVLNGTIFIQSSAIILSLLCLVLVYLIRKADSNPAEVLRSE